MNAPLDTPRVDLAADAMARLTSSRRGDGWTGERQRAFCEALAQGSSVARACEMLGMSASSAYAFRSSARGAAFAIGWSAAQLLQRHRLADALAERAGGAGRHRHPCRRQPVRTPSVRQPPGDGDARPPGSSAAATDGDAPADGDAHAARLAAGEFDRYLDLLVADAAPARAAMFVALRGAADPGRADLAAIARLGRADLYVRVGAGVPAEVDTADLDIAARTGWTAEQWARAEAAGLVSLDAPAPATPPTDPQLIQHSPAEPPAAWENHRVWEDHDGWRTDFPPPRHFTGKEFGRFGEQGYERELDAEEADLLDWRLEDERDKRARADEPARAAWLESLALPEEPSRAAPT